jgi:hypothetical protein
MFLCFILVQYFDDLAYIGTNYDGHLWKASPLISEGMRGIVVFEILLHIVYGDA